MNFIMKRLIVVSLVLLFIFPIVSTAEEIVPGFEVDGHIEGLKDGEIVRLSNRFADWQKPTWVDSCRVQHGSFHLKGPAVPEGPRPYDIIFNGHRIKANHEARGGDWIRIYVKTGDRLSIVGGNINTMSNEEFSKEVMIYGNAANFASLSFGPIFYGFWDSYSKLGKALSSIRDSIGFDKSLVQGLIEAKFILDEGLNESLSKTPPPYKVLLPTLLYNINEAVAVSHYHGFFLQDLYNNLADSVKNSFYGKILKDNAKLAVGQPMPEASLPTVEGKIIFLKEFASHNKMTIVHFWASNSYDREKYQQELRFLYKNYESKGLGIIGVSADSVATEWKTRVMVEQYPWANVSDLKGNLKGGIVNDVYHEGGHSTPNTTNVLIDQTGKIIAWDANGVELQWYLWKYLGE
jgi:peroxiredoxin